MTRCLSSPEQSLAKLRGRKKHNLKIAFEGKEKPRSVCEGGNFDLEASE